MSVFSVRCCEARVKEKVKAAEGCEVVLIFASLVLDTFFWQPFRIDTRPTWPHQKAAASRKSLRTCESRAQWSPCLSCWAKVFSSFHVYMRGEKTWIGFSEMSIFKPAPLWTLDVNNIYTVDSHTVHGSHTHTHTVHFQWNPTSKWYCCLVKSRLNSLLCVPFKQGYNSFLFWKLIPAFGLDWATRDQDNLSRNSRVQWNLRSLASNQCPDSSDAFCKRTSLCSRNMDKTNIWLGHYDACIHSPHGNRSHTRLSVSASQGCLTPTPHQRLSVSFLIKAWRGTKKEGKSFTKKEWK